MPKERIITGIDIGSTKVSIIIAAVKDQKVSVLGASGAVLSKGISKGFVIDIDQTVESISKSLERAERMAGVSITSAFVTIGGCHIKSQNSHGVVAVSSPEGEISEADVVRVTEAAQAVNIPASEELIHVIPRNFTVDVQEGVKDPVGMSGIRLEVQTNIIYGAKTSVKNLVKCLKQVGVSVSDLVFTGLASSESILTDTEKELGSVLLDIGGGTTSIIMFLEGSPVYSTVLPIGGNHITHDLAIGLRARLDEAERIKLKLSDDQHRQMTIGGESQDFLDISDLGIEEAQISKKFLYEVIDARLNEIFKLTALEVEKAGLTEKLPAGVILTGGGALTANAEKIAKKAMRMPSRLGVPKGVTGLIEDIQTPAFAASVGSVLYGAQALEYSQDLSFEKSRSIFNVFTKFKDKLTSFLP